MVCLDTACVGDFLARRVRFPRKIMSLLLEGDAKTRWFQICFVCAVAVSFSAPSAFYTTGMSVFSLLGWRWNIYVAIFVQPTQARDATAILSVIFTDAFVGELQVVVVLLS